MRNTFEGNAYIVISKEDLTLEIMDASIAPENTMKYLADSTVVLKFESEFDPLIQGLTKFNQEEIKAYIEDIGEL